jgi:hypothetical protein
MNRTRHTSRIVLTARELGALTRFLARKTVEGDVALTEGVLRQIVERRRKVKA